MGFSAAKFSLLDHAAEVIVASSKKEKVDAAVAKLDALISEKKLVGKVGGIVVDASKADAVKEMMAKVGELDHLVWTATGPIDIKQESFKDSNLEVQAFNSSSKTDCFPRRIRKLSSADIL